MNNLLRCSKLFVKRNASTILTSVGGVGVVATSVMAVKATPKAIALLEQAKEEKQEAGSAHMVFFEMLKSSLINEDFNSADLICAEIKKYSYPAEMQEVIDVLLENVLNLDSEAALAALEKIKR